ncbi:MAG: carbamate kinase [Acidimicrobiia bacterium]|nr:carbamate kinase [Acidimicrobiia bacterium]
MPTAVIAIGGNSLIRDKDHQSVQDQYEAAAETDHRIAALVGLGWDVVVSHGNGPQVGFILRRSELAAHELHEVPLEVCGADTQGAIGYALQQNLYNDFLRLGIDKGVATVVTQVEVAPDDPAFGSPAKPIGSFMDESAAQVRLTEGWDVVEDAGRGWRRVVASPNPLRIVEIDAIRHLLAAGMVVIAVGGGGIPVIADEEGVLRGVAAVIDKDLASALLANLLDADLLLISTAVEKVSLNFGKPDQTDIDVMTVAEAKAYLAEGSHFAKGSMAPKIQAAVSYLERGGQMVIITDPEHIEEAVAGSTGTRIVP